MLGDNAPQFFCAGIAGSRAEGDNVILSFATPIPSFDHRETKYDTNVRVVMSKSSVKQMIEFLSSQLNNSATQTAFIHTEPEAKQ